MISLIWKCILCFNSFFENVSELDIKFDVLASFLTSGTLFIDASVTEGLIKLHKQYHKEFEDLIEFANQYYISNNWDPLCTVARRLNSEQMIEAMKYSYQEFLPLSKGNDSVKLPRGQLLFDVRCSNGQDS
ncbi:hypothetical protein [Paenibacillus sedimenti]|uniref:Uncharacterized protein n=1 Tax=Paenibacillus sedimenti TaxID=2770274 RepID=A0A926KPW0_9BACL|nr:hypothetical protein [Paenibacillus sedimenti]MBD0380971.1 hypothetical protein [Paenibacillus sedimenti]